MCRRDRGDATAIVGHPWAGSKGGYRPGGKIDQTLIKSPGKCGGPLTFQSDISGKHDLSKSAHDISYLREVAIFRSSSTPPDTAEADRAGPAAFLPALVLAALGFVALIGATLSTGGDGQGQYLILAAPWSGRAQMMDMVARADGGVVGFGAVPFLAIAMADRPDFDAAMRDQGAWLVLPSPVLLGCSDGGQEVRR